MTEKVTGLALLREPFPENQISKLPKGTKAQNDCDASEKKNCAICGGWHHPKIVHLDYVGHAALTDRLLNADPLWYWEPMAFTDGLPAFDKTGGLWIRLFVCGHSRIGYGHAAGKTHMDVGAREKEVIGDALRNAAMRFGAALDLWHKGDLHVDDEEITPQPQKQMPIKQALPSGQGQPKSGARQMIDKARLTELQNIATDLHTLVFDQNDIGIYEVAESITDSDEKTALWTFLDSEDRSYIKKVCARLREEDSKGRA